MSKTSFQVYLNLEDEDEKLIFDYLENRNKNFVVKRLILNEINQVQSKPKNEEQKEDYGDIFNQ